MTHIPPNHYLVEYHDGPLDGHTLPIYDKVFDHPGLRHGVPSRGENGNGGVIWSYAHRWPVDCPRYVLTPGEPNIARWRGITRAESNRGELDEAFWRGWMRVLHPLEYVADVAYFARTAAERSGLHDPKALAIVADNAVVAVRNTEHRAQGSYVRGDTIPDEIDYVCDMRGNMQVRLSPGRSQWFQPGADAYTAYPDRYVWIPPIRYTSALLARGPLTVVDPTVVTELYRTKLDALRDLAVAHRSTRETDLGDS